MSAKPLVSVIALFDRGEFEPCLSSLLKQEGVEFEIIAVAGDVQAASNFPANALVRLLSVEKRNPAFRRNLAATHARGRYLAFIDDDAFAPADWLRKGTAYLENNSIYAGVAGPNLCPADAGWAERLTDMLLTTPLIGGGSRAYRGGGRPAPARPGEAHLVNLLVRRDWFDRVNGLNEEMGYGGEDTEFLHLLGRLGGKIMFDPSVAVFHRRRPFGLSYFRQRFFLRRQSARLAVAYPRVYVSNPAFLAAVLALPLALVAFIFCPFLQTMIGLLSAAAVYSALTIVLSNKAWRKRPAFLLVAPPAFLMHHLVYLGGLWWGFSEAALTGPRRVRKKLKRNLDSCGMGQEAQTDKMDFTS